MAGIATEESEEGRSLEGVLSSQQQQCQSGETLAEWRSSEQVENGTPSTSPPYWDSDSDDDNGNILKNGKTKGETELEKEEETRRLY